MKAVPCHQQGDLIVALLAPVKSENGPHYGYTHHLILSFFLFLSLSPCPITPTFLALLALKAGAGAHTHWATVLGKKGPLAASAFNCRHFASQFSPSESRCSLHSFIYFGGKLATTASTHATIQPAALHVADIERGGLVLDYWQQRQKREEKKNEDSHNFSSPFI